MEHSFAEEVKKIKELENIFKGYSATKLKAIRAKTLIMMGDRDAVRAEHAVEMYRLIPNAQLAIFPAPIISCFTAVPTKRWRFWGRFSTRHDRQKETRRMNDSGS